MAVSVTIWHNPRCSKSRATLKLLLDRGIDPAIRNYLERPPSAAELREALLALGLPAWALVRKDEPEWAAAGLRTENSDADLIDAMSRHPKLIERPVVFHRGKARIGRPPEVVLNLFKAD